MNFFKVFKIYADKEIEAFNLKFNFVRLRYGKMNLATTNNQLSSMGNLH
jgi:hypothetical protein